MKTALLAVFVATIFTAPGFAQVTPKPVLKEPLSAGKKRDTRVEIVHRFEGIMPVGVAVNTTAPVAFDRGVFL